MCFVIGSVLFFPPASRTVAIGLLQVQSCDVVKNLYTAGAPARWPVPFTQVKDIAPARAGLTMAR